MGMRSEWNNSTAREWRVLVMREALETITKAELSRLDELQTMRRAAMPKHVQLAIKAEGEKADKVRREVVKLALWMKKEGIDVDFKPAGCTSE